MKNNPSVRDTPVWDLPVRLMHWAQLIAIIAAWITSAMTNSVHEYVGYSAGVLVLMRLFWGGIGNRYARFSQFLKPVPATLQYLRLVIRSKAPRYIGHNPLGGWMMLALLSCVGLLVLTGWAMGTDLLWGYAWPVRVHVAIAWTMVGLIALHVLGAIYTGWLHRENLVKAMLTGKKAAPEPDDVD
ncbi:cytochrome b561 [Undibacterium sp. KW1]|uniref:cytochrome b/b6 domain-containing protein n=1 Tax=Undibacterium sp. KW1 TaxID=2058624 RepID=UPI001331E5C0|nr:cytochrome b/b6 domain-containing protein [Undibacterium sp. KW1]BBB61246.1 cytochrome b561 [Undibacterium sp. KW1]